MCVEYVCCVLLEIYYNVYCRRAPLAAYMCMEAIYAVYYALRSRGVVTSVPHGEVRCINYCSKFCLQTLCFIRVF